MQHDLVGVVCPVALVTLAPVIADCVREDVTGPAEVCRGNAAANVRVSLQSVLGVLVPEVECAVCTSCGEGAVDGVK